jgi:hypothetical protein
MSRRTRRARRQTDAAIREFTEFIDDNPVVSAVAAATAGAVATSLFKMFVGQPAGVAVPAAKPVAKKKKAVKKKSATKKKKKKSAAKK